MSTVTAPARPLAERMDRIEISATLAITAEASALRATGAKLVDFGAGEPHFATPRHIKDAGIRAIEENFTRYTAVGGIPELRRAIVDRHATDFGSSYSPDEAIFTTGGKLALFEAVQALIEDGDEVIVPVPYWLSYKDIIQYAGGVPVYLETSESENFRVTAKAIEALLTPRSRAIVLNTPSNPSGAVIAPGDLEQVIRLANSRGIWALMDECYAYLQYTGESISGGSFKDCKDTVVVLGSLSKTYAMTGWRAGYALGPKPVITAMAKLQSQSTSSPAAMVQKAAIAALTGDQECVRAMREDYRSLRDRVLACLERIPGVTCTRPEGAFYVYPNVSKYLGSDGPRDTTELARRLLHEAHVVVVPGDAFGTREHIRLAYAVTAADIDEGTARMQRFFAAL
jgi:aspartate aminotransferase